MVHPFLSEQFSSYTMEVYYDLLPPFTSQSGVQQSQSKIPGPKNPPQNPVPLPVFTPPGNPFSVEVHVPKSSHFRGF